MVQDPSAIINHSPNVKVVNCKKVIKSHTAYKSEPKLYQYGMNELTGTPADQYYTLPA